MKIAIDALGGDNAPKSTINGALLAINEFNTRGSSDLEITLVGDGKRLAEFAPVKSFKGLSILDVPDFVSQDSDDPHIAGAEPASAIRTAMRMHREGKFDAVVSAGSTGAQVLASLLELEKCNGITRPAVGAVLPTVKGKSYLIDVGASLVATSHHLVQFAAMGLVYAREVLDIDEPQIGLLNVGRESEIGERNVVEAHRLLNESGFPFVGNLEGRDISLGLADVIVTNGFTGNALLKYLEGMQNLIRSVLPGNEGERLTQLVDQRFDFEIFGGEPLLGVKGVSIICHGASGERAIASAIRKAIDCINLRLHEKIETYIEGKFSSYFSRVKYLRSFRRGLRWSQRESDSNPNNKD